MRSSLSLVVWTFLWQILNRPNFFITGLVQWSERVDPAISCLQVISLEVAGLVSLQEAVSLPPMPTITVPERYRVPMPQVRPGLSASP